MNKYFYKELPPSLSCEEQNKLLRECKNRNKEIEDKLLLHNTRFVAYIITKFSSYECDDLFSVGCIGLKKAIATFDYERNILFATYARKCIENEVIKYIRILKKHENVGSLDSYIANFDGNKTLLDFISDQDDFTMEIEEKESIEYLHQIIERINEKEKNIIEMYFGFNGKRYSQQQIAARYNVTQSNISRIIKRVLKIIKIKLLEEDSDIEQKRKIKK